MSVTLYSAWYCPFAQRAWMALMHKQIGFEYIEVDPYQDSSWWKGVSRGLNLVPVLVVKPEDKAESATIVDSTRVLEYLEDLKPNSAQLFPSNPEEKAEIRFWMDHINQRIVPYIYRFLEAQEPGDYRNESRESLIVGIQQLMDNQYISGPFFGGKNINVLDLLVIPFAFRIDALLGYYREFSLPTGGKEWSRYEQWYNSMKNHEVFKKSQTHGEDYRQRLIEHYLPYSQGQGQQDVTKV